METSNMITCFGRFCCCCWKITFCNETELLPNLILDWSAARGNSSPCETIQHSSHQRCQQISSFVAPWVFFLLAYSGWNICLPHTFLNHEQSILQLLNQANVGVSLSFSYKNGFATLRPDSLKTRKCDEAYLSLRFTNTAVGNKERPQCVVFLKILASDNMNLSKLRHHYLTSIIQREACWSWEVVILY